jgi:hypothetical protein
MFPSLGGETFKGPLHVQLTALLSLERKVAEGSELYRYREGSAKQAPIDLFFEMDSLEDSILFNFVRTLEGVPLGVFFSCKECNRYFLNVEKRKKMFCSNVCASRYGARRRRNTLKARDPQAHGAAMAASAERAHERYEKKIKKGLPSAKVKRNPSKYKKS